MARGRMLNKKISESNQMNQLPDDTCRLLATWLIAHLDKNGVFHAEPMLVRSQVMPWRGDIPIEQIAFYLQEMHRVGLIIIFEAKGQKWLYWPAFNDNQINLRTDRESTSFPLPPQSPDGAGPALNPEPSDNSPKAPQDGGGLPESILQDGGGLPESILPNISLNLNQSNLNQINSSSSLHTGATHVHGAQGEDELKKIKAGTNGKANGPPPHIDQEFAAVSALYCKYFGDISAAVGDLLGDYLDDAELAEIAASCQERPADWVQAAIKEAGLNKAQNPDTYLRATLNDWITRKNRKRKFNGNGHNRNGHNNPNSPPVSRATGLGEWTAEDIEFFRQAGVPLPDHGQGDGELPGGDVAAPG